MIGGEDRFSLCQTHQKGLEEHITVINFVTAVGMQRLVKKTAEISYKSMLPNQTIHLPMPVKQCPWYTLNHVVDAILKHAPL